MIKLNKDNTNNLKKGINLKYREYYIIKGNSKLKTKKEILKALLNGNVLRIKDKI